MHALACEMQPSPIQDILRAMYGPLLERKFVDRAQEHAWLAKVRCCLRRRQCLS